MKGDGFLTLKELYWFNEQHFPLPKKEAMKIFQNIMEKMGYSTESQKFLDGGERTNKNGS